MCGATRAGHATRSALTLRGTLVGAIDTVVVWTFHEPQSWTGDMGVACECVEGTLYGAGLAGAAVIVALDTDRATPAFVEL